MEREEIAIARIPVSSYRLQFNRGFTFSDAKNIISYLNELGITDIYSSPYFKAKKGSLHGYDIVDPSSLNPEIGTDGEYDEFVAELQNHSMGQILDIVPNHMCIESKDNKWWMDILENGPGSLYNKYFDIDWKPVKKELQNKVLIPILGDQYGRVLENKELQLSFEEGEFFINYYDHKFPINPKTYVYILQHRIDQLKEHLPSNNPDFLELLNIVAGLSHLPPYTERSRRKIDQGLKGKEIFKKRLGTVAKESIQVRNFINENVGIFNGVKGESKSFDLLDILLDKQVYRLSYWRVATEEINYRRFFDINSLGSIRMEERDVFEKTHALIFKLIREGKVTGLRIDHPDGLYNPSEYLHWLQRNCFLQARLGHREKLNRDVPLDNDSSDRKADLLKLYYERVSTSPQYKPFFIIGEKILAKGERIPEEWPIFSTTGYGFMNSVNGIFIDSKNVKIFDAIYFRFINAHVHFQDVVYESKSLIMKVSMSSELNTLGHYLNNISEKDRHTRDFTLYSLTDAIREVIAFFPVYRTYINSFEVQERDQQYVEFAVAKAKRKNPAMNESIFNFLRDILLLRFPEDFGESDKKEWLDFAMKFQQVTGPVMAKGLEDTAFYIYNRLISSNEVGGTPDRFGTPLEAFHGHNIERMKFWPHALITSSTHDSKRSEDVRARINVLSEIPDEWKRRLIFWKRFNKKKRVIIDGRAVPDHNEEYLLYQTLIGTWPIETMDPSGLEKFKNRIKEYMIKALREAKVNTSWINPNALYEEALTVFIDSILTYNSGNQFFDDFVQFQNSVSAYGMHNSLSQTLLKIASPGFPDFYQGTEVWNFRLVDPDNREPVDYQKLIEVMNHIKNKEKKVGQQQLIRELTDRKENGNIKLYIIYKALNYRKAHSELFKFGEYIPLEVSGDRAENVCAFMRRLNNKRVIAIVPRFLTHLVKDPQKPPFGKEVWKDSFVIIPFAVEEEKYRNILSNETVTAESYHGTTGFRLSELFMNSPVVFLERLKKQKK